MKPYWNIFLELKLNSFFRHFYQQISETSKISNQSNLEPKLYPALHKPHPQRNVNSDIIMPLSYQIRESGCYPPRPLSSSIPLNGGFFGTLADDARSLSYIEALVAFTAFLAAFFLVAYSYGAADRPFPPLLVGFSHNTLGNFIQMVTTLQIFITVEVKLSKSNFFKTLKERNLAVYQLASPTPH